MALARIDQPSKILSKDRQDLEDLLRRAAQRLALKPPEQASRQAEFDESAKLVAAAG